MSVLAFDFYAEDDPNGTLLGTLDETDLIEMELRPALHELGSGLLVVSRHSTAATSTLIRENNIVKVRIPSVSEDPIWAFMLKEGKFVLIDSKEQGGEHLTFGGPGLIYLLGQARLYHSSQVSDQPFRGSVDRPGMWTWINEPYGAILTRLIEEGRESPFPSAAGAGSALEHVTVTFDRVNDSDGNPWPTFDVTSLTLDATAALSVIMTTTTHGFTGGSGVTFTSLSGGAGLSTGVEYFVYDVPTPFTFRVRAEPSGPLINFTTDITAGAVESTTRTEFSTPIGSDMLSVAERLSVAGDLYLVMDPDLTLHAYQTFGRDLTGAFASDNVRFEKGVNILTQLVREIHARDLITHLLQQDKDGAYSTEVIPGYTTAQRKHWGYFEASQTNNDSQLNKIAQNVIAAAHTSGQAHELEITPGFVPASGRYMPGPEGTDGHFWVGDHVTLHTGTGEHDFDDAEQTVVAIRIVLDEAADDSTDDTSARSLHIVPELNYQEVRGFTGVSPAQLGQPGYCCGPSAPSPPTAGGSTRLYFSQSNDTVDPAASAVWDTDSAGGGADGNLLKTTADGTYSGSGSNSTSAAGQGGTDVRLGSFTFPLDAGLAAVIAAGGATFKMQARAHSRSGIGISEAAQDNISQIVLRVTEGATTTIRGTAYAGHSLASSAGATKWPAQSTLVNRVFPPAPASSTLSAVAGTAAVDRLVVEVGYRSFTVGTTGGGINLCNANADDLPEDELESGNFNAWLEISTSGTAGSTTSPVVNPGEESPGTNTGVFSPIDHAHAHGFLADDAIHLHDADQIDGLDTATNGVPWFNVIEYGALGDGTTDDQAAINDAIAALNAAGRGVLYFPASDYLSSGALTAITVPCTILGDGAAGGGTSFSTYGSRVVCSSGTAVLFTIQADAYNFENLALMNNQSTPSAGAGIAVTANGDHGQFRNITVEGFYIDIDIQEGGEWRMAGCHLLGPELYALKIRHIDIPDGGDWSISDSWFTADGTNATAAIWQESGGGGKISNVKINARTQKFVDGIHVAISTGITTSILELSNVSIENVTGDAVDISTVGTGTFSQVVIDGLQVGLYSNNTGRAVKVTAPVLGDILGVSIDGLMAITDGTARAAVELTNVDVVTLGEMTLLDGFTSRYTQSGSTNITDTGVGASALDDLTDVTITAAAEGDMLRFDGSLWVNTPGRWEPVTTNPGGGPELVWDGDEILMTWVDT